MVIVRALPLIAKPNAETLSDKVVLGAATI
jgi:hypothetical protein